MKKILTGFQKVLGSRKSRVVEKAGEKQQTLEVARLLDVLGDLRLFGNPVFVAGVGLLLAHKEDDGYDIGNFTGIGFRYPVLGGLLTLFLVSLAGIPPPRGSSGSSTSSARR